MLNYLKNVLFLVLIGLFSPMMAWSPSDSGHACNCTPTQMMGVIDGVQPQQNPSFDSCAMSCSNQYWESSATFDSVGYTRCLNECIVDAGFYEVDENIATSFLSNTCSPCNGCKCKVKQPKP